MNEINKEALELVEKNFDNLENNFDSAIDKKSHGIFTSNNELRAHGVVGEYIKKLDAKTFYLGWNGEVYPQFIVKKVIINPIYEHKIGD